MKLTLTLILTDDEAAVLTAAMKQENARLEAAAAKDGSTFAVFTLDTWVDEMLRNTIRNAVSVWRDLRYNAALMKLKTNPKGLTTDDKSVLGLVE
jgi:hypothetical protein